MMPTQLRRLGILGGTFDPIHYGHLRIAELAREAFDLEQVVFVPNGRPAHKNSRTVSSPLARLAMTELAIASNPHFACSRVEIDRAGPSYARDTVRAFRQHYPGLDALFWIVGADTVPQIPTWYEAAQLVQECTFIAVTRPGIDDEAARLPHGFGPDGCMLRLDAPGLEISASDLRLRLHAGRSIKYLVPDSVEEYLRKNPLYFSL